MAIRKQILEQMHRETPDLPQLTGNSALSGQPNLPLLQGSPAQIKWALAIRDSALKLTWPAGVAGKLATIVDATWWIANRYTLPVLKYKEPAAAQQSFGTPVAASAEVAPENLEQAGQTNAAETERVTDAEQWAHSVSQTPVLAEAAILAVLSRLYKNGFIKDSLKQRAQQLMARADAATEKDQDAIRRMLQ